MTPTQRLILGLAGALVATWVIRHAVISIFFRWIDVLTLRSPRFTSDAPPLVSAVIPARNEEDNLADCLATVCAQTYPHLEILVVDDRSTDRTAEIARQVAAADPRVHLITIDELPSGWTGKTHALHQAAAEAHGDWLWFLDADTRHEPESLEVVVQYAESNGAALASILPRMRCETFWESVVQPLEGIVLMRSFPLFRVNRDDHPAAFANGQYILVRRSAYDAAGGHLAVRDRFVEDIYLAKRVKGLGLPIRVAIAPEISSTRMYTSLPHLVRGWSRILYDALGRRVTPLLGKVVEPLVITQSGYLVLLAGLFLVIRGTTPAAFAWWLLVLGVAHLILSDSVLFRMYRFSGMPGRSAVWYPLAGLISDWISFRAIVMCLTGRVTWRGTTYGPEAAAEPASPEASRT